MLGTSITMRALFLRTPCHGVSVLPTATTTIATTMQRHFQGSLGGVQEASHPSAGSSSSESTTTATGAAASIQQLYKSSHKGSGEVPMPKPLKPKKLKSRTIPTISNAEAAILGARSSCAEDLGPVPERALSPLQKRQLLFKSKAAFVLTPQALRRVKYLLSHYESKAPSNTNGAEQVASEARAAASVPPCGIRIGVRRRGCSGYSYTVNYYFTPDPKSAAHGARDTASSAKGKGKGIGGSMDDVVVEQEGVKVVVDGDALFYVIGTEMDYVVRNVEEKFTFKNPNQKYSCGCEESFMPFDEDDLDD